MPAAIRRAIALHVWPGSPADDGTAQPARGGWGLVRPVHDTGYRNAGSAFQVAAVCRRLFADIAAPIHAYNAAALGLNHISACVPGLLVIACSASGIHGPLVTAGTDAESHALR
jgi:hypothetical protein